jgi:hypothetical protein
MKDKPISSVEYVTTIVTRSVCKPLCVSALTGGQSQNLCLNKAINSQIRHAHLPIGRYVSLATRKVLTVNQVRFS